MASMSSSFYIISGSICSVLFGSCILTAMFCYASKKKCRRSLGYEGPSPTLTSSQAHTFLRIDTPNNNAAASVAGSYSSFRRVTPIPQIAPIHHINDFKTSKLTDDIAEILVEKQNIQVQSKLQEGKISLF